MSLPSTFLYSREVDDCKLTFIPSNHELKVSLQIAVSHFFLTAKPKFLGTKPKFLGTKPKFLGVKPKFLGSKPKFQLWINIIMPESHFHLENFFVTRGCYYHFQLLFSCKSTMVENIKRRMALLVPQPLFIYNAYVWRY